MKVLVTGVTGTLGTALTDLLLLDGHEVIGFSRCEYKQSLIPQNDRLTLYVGDVRDRDRLIEASRGVDLIIHTAALKRVETLEANPDEAVKTNLGGTENVLHAQRVNGTPKVVLVSTDKAVNPINTYGMSKAIAERLVLRNEKNAVVRYGNVLGSRGSVLPIFINQLETTNRVQITDKRMTRFWITLNDAAKFVLKTAIKDHGGVHIPDIRAYPVYYLAVSLAECMGLKMPFADEIGMRPGEKLHEELRREDEGGIMRSDDNKLWYSKTEIKDVLSTLLGDM